MCWECSLYIRYISIVGLLVYGMIHACMRMATPRSVKSAKEGVRGCGYVTHCQALLADAISTRMSTMHAVAD